MYFEYAIDPKVVATWGEPINFAYFKGKFGADSGRVVAFLPKKWPEIVMSEYQKIPKNADDIDRKRYEVFIIQKLMEVSIRSRDYIWKEDGNWLENAEKEHERLPFHLILAEENPRNNPDVQCVSELILGSEGKFESPPTVDVGKIDSEEIIEVVWPMLRCSNQILLIDSYFAIDQEKNKNLLKLLKDKFACNGICPTIEIHVTKPLGQRGEPDWNEFIKPFYSELPNYALCDQLFKVFLWCQKEEDDEIQDRKGRKPHNRYILTDIGGVGFSYGLDELRDEDSRNDIYRLSKDMYYDWWDSYSVTRRTFKLIGSWEYIGEKV